MKKFKPLACLAMFALLFTSCSKEESINEHSGETATLSFATVLNDLVENKAALKQAIPACSDASPAYVAVVLSGTENIGTQDDPVMINVSPNPGDYDGDGKEEYFTEESSDLELRPGNYTLEHFVVYDANHNMIWVAPKADSDMAGFVTTTLPMNFDLGAGVKKYVDVDVLCFEDRLANEYGYLFFELEGTRAIEFCIFGNYCDPNGRHYPAAYSVNVWSYQDGQRGEALYTNVSNNVEMNTDGDYAADPLCFALPDREGLDEYYFEITLEDSDAYGDVQNRVIRRGVIDDNLVRTFFDGDNNIDYYHFREGECDTEDGTPIFSDPEDIAENYKACLYQLNDSGAMGFAYLRMEGNNLEATILAAGLENNKMHPQHIHGFEDNSMSTCPDDSDDTNGDGLISLEEGLPFYGPVLLPLTEEDGEYPIAYTQNGVDGVVVYKRNFSVNSAEVSHLENRAVVLHGMTVGGEYWPTLPVACGTVESVD